MKDIMQKIADGREYRRIVNIECRAKEEEGDTETYIVEGYATTFEMPYTLFEDRDYIVNEVVDKDAFDKTDMSDVILQYDHAGRVFARTKNETLKLTIDDRGLHVRADLGGTEIGRQLYEEIRGGYTDKMSFGFTVRGDEVTETNNGDEKTILERRILDIGRLYDVSAVSIPANDSTVITARAFADGAIAKAESERIQAEIINTKRKALEERLTALKG